MAFTRVLGPGIHTSSNIKRNNIESTGIITAVSFVGDASNLTGIAADKIFEGNTEAEVVDTGTNGHFKVTTEGSERLRITSAGLVGIGTDNPTNALEVKTSGTGVFKLITPSEGGVPLIVAANANTASPSNQFFVAHSGASVNVGNARGGNLNLYTSNAERLRITSDGSVLNYGNVGIQTTDITSTEIVGAGNSFVGMYLGDGFIGFSTMLNRSGGYYITTSINALNAGPVTLGSEMTLDGTWVIV